jgi:REP element-mobilizing transposase RayT
MPRPIRIEYPGAIYHVMNRGRGRCDIFYSDEYYQSFIDILNEAYSRFGMVIHSYCLMSNHYHLLIETPNGNLGRIMRHINGLYTQKYNRLRKTDGPLFRGRYKAILVEESEYLLCLSRYIHRNPIDTKVKIVKELKNYKWSSYPSYINLVKNSPDWLNKEKTLKMFGGNVDPLKNYEIFVNSSNEIDPIKQLYQKRNIPAILGSKSFKEEILFKKLAADSQKREMVVKQIYKSKKLTIDQIVRLVSKVCVVDVKSIVDCRKGRHPENLPRSFAMFVCQKYQDLTLREITDFFNLSNIGSTSKAIFRIKEIIKSGKLMREMK